MTPFDTLPIRVCALPGCCVPARSERAIYCSRLCAIRASNRGADQRRRAGIAPVPRDKPARRRRAGDHVGGWELLRIEDFAWIARCLGCGVEKEINAAKVSPAGCLECSGVRRRLPRLCRTCGTTDERAFGRLATECSACNRAACRNGRCGCGRARRARRDCPCGRRAGTLAGRILNAVDALHAAHVAPTPTLLRLALDAESGRRRQIFGEAFSDLVRSGALSSDRWAPDPKPCKPARPRIDWRAAVEHYRTAKRPDGSALTTSDMAALLKCNRSTVLCHFQALGVVTKRGRPRKAPDRGDAVRLSDVAAPV